MAEPKDYTDETYVEGMLKNKGSSVRGKLKIMNGLYKNKEVLIDKQYFTMGRSTDCCLTLHDKKVSRIHAQLIESMGKEIVEDLGSSNGTRVNGHNITKKILKSGDIIQVGNTDLMYVK